MQPVHTRVSLRLIVGTSVRTEERHCLLRVFKYCWLTGIRRLLCMAMGHVGYTRCMML